MSDSASPFIVAIDFDGVIAQYDGYKGDDHFLPPKPWAKEAIDVLRAHGIKVIIWTCRNNEAQLKEYLDKFGIGYDAINADVHPEIKSPDQISRKVLADVYVDDRAVHFIEWNSAMEQILDRMAAGVK
jgi:adenylylsulfate kinase